MQLPKIAAVLSLFGALGIGLAAVYIADSRQEVSVVDGPAVITSTLATQTLINPESLAGEWRGTFGYNSGACTIEINRVRGDTFYGFLRKNGAKIAIFGTVEPETRKVLIQETAIFEVGDEGGWTLGRNSAVISADGRSMIGTGDDGRGLYGWNVSRER